MTKVEMTKSSRLSLVRFVANCLLFILLCIICFAAFLLLVVGIALIIGPEPIPAADLLRFIWPYTVA